MLNMLKLIGIDFGYSRIGFASGQLITKTATPIGTILAKRGSPQWNEIDNIIRSWYPDKIIIGLPIDTKDKETKITKDVRIFAKEIQKRYQKPIDLINEVFSTREAHWRLS